MSDFLQAQLQALRARSLYRSLHEVGSAQGPEIQFVGQRVANFSSNDYLGFANHEALRQAATDAIAEFGVGSGASRLLSGTQSPHMQLETALAQWKGAQAALAFNSGYAAAVGTIPALVGKSDVIILDKLSHASLIDGARLSGATIRVFPHNHLGKLESHLEWARREKPGARSLVITESIFSMDGDRVPLRLLTELKSRFGAMLLLDEAHAVGVIGPHGRGLAAHEGLESEVDIHLGTLSKALGASGGYVSGSRKLIEWLINRARAFIFSTAPPPAIAAAAKAAIELLQSPVGDERRQTLWQRIRLLREVLPPGLTGDRVTNEEGSAIHPWLVGDEESALEISRALRREGFLAPAIRYPTVAKGAARLRLTLTALHQETQIRALAEALARISNNR